MANYNVSGATLRLDPLTLVALANHRLARNTAIAISDLEEESFVMFQQDSGTGTYPEILRLCRAAGFEPKVSMEAREPSIIIGLVAAGCGISILPESFNYIRIKGVCYRPISDAAASMQLMLASRSSETSPLVASFFKLAVAIA